MKFKVKYLPAFMILTNLCMVGMQVSAQGVQINNQETKDYDGYSQAYITCMKSAGDNILRDDACKSVELKYQDTRLNKIYKDLVGALKPEKRNALIIAEKSWLQLKSADTNFESLLYGDTQIDNAQRLKNDLLRTKNRVQVLDKYLKFVQIVGN